MSIQDTRLRDGIAAARAKRVDAARTLLREAVDAAPDNPLAWFWLAVVSPTADAAISHLRRALAIDPSHVAARAALAKLLLAQAERMRDATRGLLRDAVVFAPGDVRIWRAIVRLAPTPEEAVTDVRNLLPVAPDGVDPRMFLRDALIADARMCELAALAITPVATSDADNGVETPRTGLDPLPSPQSTSAPVVADDANASASSHADDEEECPTPPSTTVTRTVMVIDDSPTICKILSLTLEDAGYAVVTANSGESALRHLSAVVPDVILLDIAMPGIDGYETCKRIKADSRTAHVPVLMLSGKDALFDKVKGHMAGATEYLTKPFEAATVLAAVADACSEAA